MNQSVSTLTGKIKIKIVFLGNQSVGKSSVIEKYVHNRFDESSHPTVGIDFLAKNIAHKNKNYRLQLWDTAGQQRFRSLIPSYLKDAQIALILFDVTNRASLENVESWIKMYNDNKTGGGFIFLIGNKIDLTRDRQISREEGIKKAQQLNIPYYQISAKTAQNLQTLFSNLLDVCNANSIEAAKLTFNKSIEAQKIDEVEQKNQEDKQKVSTHPSPKDIINDKVLEPEPQNATKVIRLDTKQTKEQAKTKSCC